VGLQNALRKGGKNDFAILAVQTPRPARFRNVRDEGSCQRPRRYDMSESSEGSSDDLGIAGTLFE
jgi:hypothetical protein